MAIALAPEEVPTIALDSPADASSTADTTPDFLFTGTDINGDTLEYQIQIDTVNTFDSQSSTPALVSNTSIANLNTVTTTGIDTTGANFLFCAVSVDATATPTITDNKGNTWNLI
mgnify:CR=1 FL=1